LIEAFATGADGVQYRQKCMPKTLLTRPLCGAFFVPRNNFANPYPTHLLHYRGIHFWQSWNSPL